MFRLLPIPTEMMRSVGRPQASGPSSQMDEDVQSTTETLGCHCHMGTGATGELYQ